MILEHLALEGLLLVLFMLFFMFFLGGILTRKCRYFYYKDFDSLTSLNYFQKEREMKADVLKLEPFLPSGNEIAKK